MDRSRFPERPDITGSTSAAAAKLQPHSNHPVRRRKNHRGGKKKKARTKSFATPGEDDMTQDGLNSEGLDSVREDFYSRSGGNYSNTSLDSEALLDHRDQQPFLRPRRPSIMNAASPFQPQFQTPQNTSRLRTTVANDSGDDDDNDTGPWGEGAPLLSSSNIFQKSDTFGGYGANDGTRRSRPESRASSKRSRRFGGGTPFAGTDSYNVNYPPSVPGSPLMRAADRMDMSFGDVMLRDDLESGQRSPRRTGDDSGDSSRQGGMGGMSGGFQPSPLERRHTIALQAQEDVCFPQEGLSEIGDDELHVRDPAAYRNRARRRRGKWPDLSVLNEWSRFEKEGRSEERRAKKITEPQLINGRLRPTHRGWFQAEEEAPYRFTYFNEEFQSTIHSQSISELVQPGSTFKELFIPDPPLLSDSSEDEDEDEEPTTALHHVLGGQNGESKFPSRQPSLSTTTQSYFDARRERNSNSSFAGAPAPPPGFTGASSSNNKSVSDGQRTTDIKSPEPFTRSPGPSSTKSPEPSHQQQKERRTPKPPKYGDRPVWWLDILSPTEAEMKIISKAFGIHPLTAEDIMVQEQREKVELFRHYYFVNYRTFDQDHNSENFLEPVNMYVVVFREGVLSFHFSVTPHPANVRRRIRQLRDYMILSSDWISYAIIDDITDVFGPLIQNIEDEVDDIDDAILEMHSPGQQQQQQQQYSSGNGKDMEKKDKSENGETINSAEAGRDMLRRVGDCRKKVMSLYRLLGNKADVIKGFAKRCNEHWEVAPRSEIGLYLGDIQDHIVTMTSNLSHYEKILARSHGNYLAQINIRMNERQEQTADVLGKLTVLGTIVLPMNIITGLWGMNVWVPGQEYEGDLVWFWAITAGLLFFGTACYLVAKRVYNIV
ncbi:hypothetical protein B0T17DRAFT_618542 [Bombardia bombarda]|uniref:Uncharacterized protein n=1 Tax=Bombardia bombarda TaxID=252184 RepID=A0AA40BXY6_9PEZI|nr:hypothetical protein B0T17DRAFT_618542 [Bombardia bombarda]